MAAKKRTWEDFQKIVKEKRSGKTKSKGPRPSSIMIQRMSSTPNRSKKYEPLDTRDFVDFSDYDELNIDNIRDACEKFYDMPQGSCDILLSDRGPSCFLTEQISGKKFYYVRFTAKQSAVEKPSRAKKVKGSWEKGVKNEGVPGSSSHGNAMVSSITYGKNDISLPAVPPTAFPQSISVAALLQARKLVNPPNVTRVKLELESYIVAEKK